MELDQKIYIPIVSEDEITLDNLSDSSYPRMLSEDLDLQGKFNIKKYNPESSIYQNNSI